MYWLVGALGIAVGIIVGHWVSERFWQPVLLELLSKVPARYPPAPGHVTPADDDQQLMDEESADEDRQTRDKRAPRDGWNFWS